MRQLFVSQVDKTGKVVCAVRFCVYKNRSGMYRAIKRLAPTRIWKNEGDTLAMVLERGEGGVATAIAMFNESDFTPAIFVHELQHVLQVVKKHEHGGINKLVNRESLADAAEQLTSVFWDWYHGVPGKQLEASNWGKKTDDN